MDRWRELGKRLGLGQGTGALPAAGTPPPDAVDRSEVALLLLNNATRLLDEALAPPEVIKKLKMAIAELEEYIAARPR